MRVGCVEYINALPFHLPFRLGKMTCDAEFIYDIPSKLNTFLKHKQIDAALTSSVEYLEGNYHMLPGFCIAGNQEILSVNLYTQLPLSSLSGMRVGLTHHSATSIVLLKILCKHLWKIAPLFEPLNREEPFSNYAGLLLIGDEALQHFTLPHFQRIDLSAAWYTLTGLPFVFAVFAVHPEVDSGNLKHFQHQLGAALEWSLTNRLFLEQQAIKQCSLPQELIHQYYTVLNYRLGKKEMEGLETFKKLLGA